MKIIDIKLINKIDTVIELKKNTLTLYPVTITVKKWFSKPKTINCYPTNYGPTYWGPDIVFFIYVDENGERLPDNISEQINNWCRVQQLKSFRE